MGGVRTVAAAVALTTLAALATPVAAAPVDGVDGIGTWDLHRTPVAGPDHLAVAGDGTVWWVNVNGTLGRVSPAGDFTTVTDPLLTDPIDLAVGDDGVLWVLDRARDGIEGIGIDRVTPAGQVTEVAAGASTWAGPMAVGTDGNLWFVTRYDTTSVLRRTDPSGATDNLDDADLDAPAMVTTGTGEAVVWVASGLGGVGRVVADPGDPVELLVASGPAVTAMVGDPDGSLWYATTPGAPGAAPTLVHLGADGVATSRPLAGLTSVTSLALGPDGHVWATDTDGDRVAHVDTQGDLVDAALVVIDHDTFAGPTSIVAGPDGHLWVANTDADTIGVITVDGLVSRLAPPATFGWIADVAVGGDGRVWTASTNRPGLSWLAADGSMGEVALPADARPQRLASTTDGAVWFAATDPRVGRLGPDGSVIAWPVPGVGAPSALAPAGDGGVWVATTGSGTVRVTHVAPNGTLGRQLELPHIGISGLAEHPDGSVWIVVPGEGVRRWRPDGSVETPAVEVDRGGEAVVTLDGAVWIADLGREVDSLAPFIDSRLVRIAPSGAIRSVALPQSVTALALAAGPGGDVWWVGAGVSPVRLGKVTAGGVVSLFDTGPERWVASGIAAHPDGTMWVGTSRRRLLHVGADCGDGPFLDVDATHPFCAEVSWLSRTGLTNGFPDGTFRPGAPVQRQAMAAFLWRLHGRPAPGAEPPRFADVPADHPFFDAIQWMAQGGWATGSPDPGGGLPRFEPGADVTRQAMVTFLWRLDGADTAPGAWEPRFVDVAPGHPFYTAVQWAGSTGVAAGTPLPDGGARFDPGEPISRQAAAALLQRDRLRWVVSVSV